MITLGVFFCLQEIGFLKRNISQCSLIISIVSLLINAIKLLSFYNLISIFEKNTRNITSDLRPNFRFVQRDKYTGILIIISCNTTLGNLHYRNRNRCILWSSLLLLFTFTGYQRQ